MRDLKEGDIVSYRSGMRVQVEITLSNSYVGRILEKGKLSREAVGDGTVVSLLRGDVLKVESAEKREAP